MKKLLLLPLALLSIILFMNFDIINNSTVKTQVQQNKKVIPADVQQIIDNSCFGCHNLDSKNEKGKGKLSFDTLDTLSTAKLIGKLTEINDEVSEDKMPPAKFLERKPEAKLTAEQKAKLITWTNSLSGSLLEK